MRMNNDWLKSFLKKMKLNESTISMILGALVIVVVGALIFNYFRGVSQESAEEVLPGQIEEVKLIEEGGKLVPKELPTSHKIEAGEHLWAIAEKYYGSGYNWVDIAEENKLSNPDAIKVGQDLTIPRMPVKEPIVETATSAETIAASQYTVVKGDHLWGIAVRTYGDGYRWVEIARENNLVNPDLIHPGNVLSLPR